jgi:oligopeptide/dipeptide ABC transporter ATP-binding protein
MRQRVMIAMALALDPEVLIADEPTTALDVTVQAQIMDLLAEIRRDRNMGMILITHDLGVVADVADRIAVMYAGRIVEPAAAEELFAQPMHPYTQGLFRCTPRLDDPSSRLDAIRGSMPDPAQFPSGCRFHPRCDASARGASDTIRHSLVIESGAVLKRCVEEYGDEPSGAPQLREAGPGHFVSCWEAQGR